MLHSSVTDIHEHQLIERLLADPNRRANLLGIHGMPTPSRALLRVPMQGIPGGHEGDIDILAAVPGKASESVAFEIKRVKVGPSAFQTGAPNKLRELRTAAQQANLLAKIGFAQVYLGILIVIDSRTRNAGKVTYEGLTSELRSVIANHVSLSALDSRVGLLVLDFVQPMDHEPLSTGTVGGDLRRLAIPVSQSVELTEWIERLDASAAL